MDFRFSSLLKTHRVRRTSKIGIPCMEKSWLKNKLILKLVLTSESLVCVFCCHSCRKWSAEGGWLELWACCPVTRRNLWGESIELHQTGWGWRVDLQPRGKVQWNISKINVYSSVLCLGCSPTGKALCKNVKIYNTFFSTSRGSRTSLRRNSWGLSLCGSSAVRSVMISAQIRKCCKGLW